jgi:hypothetical protein
MTSDVVPLFDLAGDKIGSQIALGNVMEESGHSVGLHLPQDD